MTVARYTTLAVRHFPDRGQFSFLRQFHCLGVVDSLFCALLSTAALWDLLLAWMVGMQLQLSFTVFLLNIPRKGLPSGKFVSIIRRNLWPMLVATLMLYGGLYHIVFSFLLRLAPGGLVMSFSW